MMAEALTRPSHSQATLGFAQSRSVRLVWVAPVPWRAPRHKGHVFVCASPSPTNLSLLWKCTNTRGERHREVVACLPLSSEIPCPAKERPGTHPMGVALHHPAAYTKGVSGKVLRSASEYPHRIKRYTSHRML